MHLRLVASPPPQPSAFELPPVDLRVRPTRPGVTHSKLQLRLPGRLAAGAEAVAGTEGLSRSVWIGLVAESERAVGQAAASHEAAAALRAWLDELAAEPSDPVPGAPARLGSFAKELRRLGRGPGAQWEAPEGSESPVAVEAMAPYSSVGAWRRSAIEAGQSLDTWAAERLRNLPSGRGLWEASAAERGETLAEWVLAQAARC